MLERFSGESLTSSPIHKVNHVGKEMEISKIFSEELQKANQELEPEGVHVFPVSVLDRDQLVLYRLKNPF